MNLVSPRVFISHASEDKDRFVIPFAKKLRERGIDAWVDQWEILPGDSLVDKIFDEGIKNAQAMIVVLSSNSVEKRWVKEELNTGVINRIINNYKLIPVVIDECDVPEALKSIVWEKISDINDYKDEFNKIVASIYDQRTKPPLGEPPKYTQLEINNLPGLTRTDTVVLKCICEFSIEIGHSFVNVNNIQDRIYKLDVSEDEMFESIDILASKFMIKGERTFSSKGLEFFSITTYGFETYARNFLPDFTTLVNQILSTLVNQNLTTNDEIAISLNKQKVLIDYGLDILERRNYLKLSKTIGGGISVFEITAQGKRAARNIQ